MSSAEIQQWLAERAIPLSGVAAGGSMDELRTFGATALEGVRVVGLGEATHGTREFFQLKHRLIEYLVTELGFTQLAMEASESAAPAIDSYVRGGTGNAAELVSDLGFWTWRTEEVVDLVEWMRSYNEGRPRRAQVGFVGIDPQRCAASVRIVEEFLGARSPDRVAAFRDGFGSLADAQPGSAPDPKRLLVREAEALTKYLAHHEAPAEVVRHAEILGRNASLVCRSHQHADPEETVFAARDRLMAERVIELAEADPEARIAVWAHNGHLSASRTVPRLRPMGQHLREYFGSGYYALALLLGSGTFRSRRLLPGPWPGRKDGPVLTHRIDRGGYNSLEGQLAAATPKDHLLDLRGDVPPTVRGWLDQTHMHRSFGSFVPRWTYRLAFAPTVLAREFDGLAYLHETTPSRPIDRTGGADGRLRAADRANGI